MGNMNMLFSAFAYGELNVLFGGLMLVLVISAYFVGKEIGEGEQKKQDRGASKNGHIRGSGVFVYNLSTGEEKRIVD